MMPLPPAIHQAILLSAKNIDLTPDLASQEYWDTHYAGVVRATELEPDAAGRLQLKWSLETTISDGSMEPVKALPASFLWFGADPTQRPQIAAGDRLLVFYPKEGPPAVAAFKLDGDAANARLLRAAQRIADLRGRDAAALSEGVFDDDPRVALYGLRALLARPELRLPDAFTQRLRRLRGQQSANGQLRVMANAVVNRLEGNEPGSNQEYEWLRNTVTSWKGDNWLEAKPLVDRLIDFQALRTDTVNLLVRIVKDPQRPQALRIAAYGALERPNLFRFSAPDGTSDLIFATLTEMQKDPDPLIRRAGSVLVHNVTLQTSPQYRGRYLDRARMALASAVATEKDEVARQQHQHYLGLLFRAQ
jgi:hypothetical protein